MSGEEQSATWAGADNVRAIERLKPESPLHGKVLKHLLTRLEMSEKAMQSFYPRWQINEKKLQAYIDLPDWEKELKAMNDTGAPPKVVSVTIPYSFATMSTIVTYLMQTFTGRKPMFQISSYKKDTADASRYMETALQYQADHTRLIKHLWQFLQDGESYGVGILKTKWKRETKMRTKYKTEPVLSLWGMSFGGTQQKVREETLTYAGNEVSSVDPYMFFPDPRVPMADVNRRGEFVFWRTYEGAHTLKRAEAAGQLRWVKDAAKTMPHNLYSGDESSRQILSGGQSSPHKYYTQAGVKDFYQIDQGSLEIIPSELGLGTSNRPEKWIFAIANKSQIIQAERLDNDHDMHPVVVSEPYSMGYGFGNAGILDYLGPMQDTLSWFVNSHIDNVRSTMNNMFVVDPSMVEMQDLTNPGAGKIIRLKESHYGRDVRSALSQLQVQDVTRGHIGDFEAFMKLGDSMSSVTDNLRGLQDSGGRKTATEVRTSGEAAASRLAAHSRIISAQAIVDLAEQMSVNTQQNLDQEFYAHLLGDLEAPQQIIRPDMLVGDFYYPVHDGTLPMDKVAMLDVWKEIFMGVAGDEQLRQEFSVSKIFEHIAELGGAKNIDSFKINVQAAGPEQMAQAAQAGNAMPIGGGPQPLPQGGML
jgi:hypothetical protein